MDTQVVAKRSNRTIYILDILMDKANILAKKDDRSTSRIIEYALTDYLPKHGVPLGPDFPDVDASD